MYPIATAPPVGFSRPDGAPVNALTIDPDPAVATHDDVVAIEVRLTLRSDEMDPQLEDYRTVEFVQLIQTPNIRTTSDSYIFIGNTGI